MAKFKISLGVVGRCRKRDYDPKRPRSAQKVCLFTRQKPRRLLGRHPNRGSAIRQERAIEIRRHGG